MKKLNFIETPFGNLIKLSFGEEVGNSVSHGIFALIMLFLIPVISVYGYLKKGFMLSLGYSIFGICMFLMFLMSTLYHTMRFNTKHKQIFRILDHCAIYFAIAGTFTPVCLNVITGHLGIIILILQWIAVIFGVLFKSISKKKTPKASVLIYLLMGWSSLLLIPNLIKNANQYLIIMIALGGIMYSIGVVFYSQKRQPWFHFIWHLFIIVASIFHFIGIIFFV